jgi:signal transduction histidine kinase
VRDDIFIGDPARIQQILMNLCSNAIKFTDAGSIALVISRQPGPRGGTQLISIALQDSGIGIRPEQMKTIFNKFVQADSSINRKYGGTGLGLTITKMLVELMGGTIDVTSELGKGSKFTVELPLQSEKTGASEIA